MHSRKPVYRFSRMAVVCLLILLTASILRLPYDPLLLGAEAEGPLPSFQGFAVIPESVAVIKDRDVVALLANVEQDLYGVIMFTAECRSGNCAIGEVIAYSIFDAQGEEVRLV